MRVHGQLPINIDHEKSKVLVKKYLEYAHLVINKNVIDYAKYMNIKINKVLKNLLSKENIYDLERVISNMLGIYGNLLANNYLEKKYKNLEKEKLLETKIGITYVDFCSIDEDVINLFEVKATNTLVLEESTLIYCLNNNYVENGSIESNLYDEKIINSKIVNCLINQIEKQKMYKEENPDLNIKINVVLLSDCIIDYKMEEYLLKNNVNVIIIPESITNVLKQINEELSLVYSYGRNIYAKENLIPIRKKKR